MKNDGKKLSSTLLRSILVYSIAIFLCFTVVFLTLFYLGYERDEEAKVSQVAENAAMLLNGMGADADVSVLRSQFERDLRYTLVDPDGNVSFDSDGGTNDNHANRPEIMAAREKGKSTVTRYSSTLGEDTVYTAVLLDSGYILRISEQRASIFSVIQSIAPALAIALVVVAALSIALSRILARRVVAPLNDIDVASPLDSETYEEMRPLLARIETQQQQLLDQNSELARAENIRREFSANVSHEMKTPLQVISGYAELIASGNIPRDDAIKFASIISDESENMKELINNVLVLSRTDDPVLENAGKEEADLMELTHEIINRLRPIAEKRSVDIQCLGSKVVIDGNRRLLDQLISNLVSNAIKYSDVGGNVMVSVGKNLIDHVPDEPPMAFIKVRDTGCGIPQEEQAKIFERFYRVDKSRSKENGGTGLGLAIAKHAAAFHNAEITVESEVGKGSTLTVNIPTEHE